MTQTPDITYAYRGICGTCAKAVFLSTDMANNARDNRRMIAETLAACGQVERKTVDAYRTEEAIFTFCRCNSAEED